MPTKFLVKNINKTASNEQLTQRIQEFAKVKSLRIKTDNVTFQSKGEAELEVANDEEGTKILATLNSIHFMGQNLEISQKSA